MVFSLILFLCGWVHPVHVSVTEINYSEKDKALQVLTKPRREIMWNDLEGPWLMAGFFSLLDEKTEALSWLERATARGWINYPLFCRMDPFLAGIRDEPRFQKLMERIKPEWENFKV